MRLTTIAMSVIMALLASPACTQDDDFLRDPFDYNWWIEEKTSPMDDSQSVNARLRALKVEVNGEVAEGFFWLFVDCSEDRTTLSLLDGITMAMPPTRLKLRFDKEPTETQQWQLSPENRLGLWDNQTSVPVIKRLAAADKFAVELNNGSLVTAQFDLSGTKKLVAKVAAACHWDSHRPR